MNHDPERPTLEHMLTLANLENLLRDRMDRVTAHTDCSDVDPVELTAGGLRALVSALESHREFVSRVVTETEAALAEERDFFARVGLISRESEGIASC